MRAAAPAATRVPVVHGGRDPGVPAAGARAGAAALAWFLGG